MTEQLLETPAGISLMAIADKYGWSRAGVITWMNSPTTYLMSTDRVALRPVDIFELDPERVLTVAENAWYIEW